jgi:hypothetical protein
MQVRATRIHASFVKAAHVGFRRLKRDYRGESAELYYRCSHRLGRFSRFGLQSSAFDG